MSSNGKQEQDDERVVLVVDDEDGVLRAFTRLLTKVGLKVLTASNAIEAFDVLASDQPVHLVLADYRLKRGPDGIYLLDAVAYRRPKAARILMTGLLDASIALAAKNHHRVIPKDLSWPLISSIIVAEVNRER